MAVATVRTRSWHVATAVGGAVVVRSAVLLAVLAVRGPGGYWFAFWTEPGLRSAYVVLAVRARRAGCWPAWSGRWGRATGRSTGGGRRASGTCGAVLLAVGGLLAAVGLEDALTVWNDQLALLPWGMARILGITTFLGIPPALPVWLVAAGGGLALVAVALALPRRRVA